MVPKGIVFGILLSGFAVVSGAQTTLRTTTRSGSVTERVYVDPYEKIEGTPYWNDTYKKGSIIMQKGTYPDMQLRYNIFQEQMEYMKNEALYVVPPELLIRRVELDSSIFVVDVYLLKDKPTFGYFLLLDSGRITLLTKMMVAMTEYVGARALQEEKPPRYVRLPDTYYLRVDNGQLIKVGSLKKLMEALPSHREEMETFARKEKISTRQARDLIRFVRHFNSLPGP